MRLAARYADLPPGRRLQRRLWAAQLTLGPAAWRCAQMLVAIPPATFLVAAGLGAPAALGLSLSLTRCGGAALLWLLRRRAREALEAAAPTMARALGTELAAWANGGTALCAAAQRVAAQQHMAKHVLQRAAARVALGADPPGALQTALEDAVSGGVTGGQSPAATVAMVFALYRHDAAATAVALDRLAASLEEDAAVRHQARTALGEVRTSAVAVPAIAAVTGAILLGSDPPALAAALTPPLLPLLAVACTGILAASLAVRRMVAV